MSISADEIRKIALLAKLELSADEERAYGQQLARIVAYIDQLELFSGEEGPESAASPCEAEDVAEPLGEIGWPIDNAPDRLDRFVLIPQVKAADRG